MTREIKLKFLGVLVMSLIVLPFMILYLAGDFYWTEGWLLNIWIFMMVGSVLSYMYSKDQNLLIERLKSHKYDGLKIWDVLWMNSSYIILVVWLLIMPLDAHRFKWSPEFPLAVKVIAGICLMVAYHYLYKSVETNTYLSSVVRIQDERGQVVIDSGVYGVVRHPMYLGAVLMAFGASGLLGSIFGVSVSMLVVLMVIFRINKEEKVLLEGLEGYKDYMIKVKYRLIPLVW